MPSDPDNVLASPSSNIVLFMPYLHWETDRQRKVLSQFIDKESEKYRKNKDATELQQRKLRQYSRGALVIPKYGVKGYAIEWTQGRDSMKAEDIPPIAPQTAAASLAAILSLYPRQRKHLTSPLFKTDKRGRVIAKTKVGQVLFDAAMLYEAMSSYRDKRFIQKYLYQDPPLHPRRTLDQAYYWTLKTTGDRDRNQVVYRGTKPTPEHSINPETGEWNCFQVDEITAKESKQQVQRTVSGMIEKRERQCNHCKNHLQNVSRLLMVDQLWMWILDEKTIITAFPRRYGITKWDPTEVHQSIRARLSDQQDGPINSVFDLAMVILDECSNVFFQNRTTTDQQPQLLDIFSQAISNINNKQIVSFQHLWEWTQKLSLKAGINTEMSKFVAPLLNISTEGKLQAEIKDVIDELDIMIDIYSQQQVVMKKFKKSVEDILSRPRPDGSGNDKQSATIHDTATSVSSPPTQKGGISGRFNRMSDYLLKDVDDRLAEFRRLRQSAKSTSESLEALVNLKQQQASVVQAWQSVQQADEGIKQGRSIMVFTVVTIVFLPLAFMSSIFGMNNPEIAGSGPMSMRTQFKLMFGISSGIIVVVLVVAYSGFVRNLFWLAYRYLMTLMVVKTPAYGRIYLGLDWRSDSMTKKVDLGIRDMKLAVKKENQRRIEKKLHDERDEAQKAEERKEKIAMMNKASPASSSPPPDTTPSSLENGRS